MTEIQKPEQLALAATKAIAEKADKIIKQRLIMAFASAAIGIGIIASAPATSIPLVVFLDSYAVWDMHRQRKACLNLREAFSKVSEDLGEHDSVHQMEPLKLAFDKFNASYSKEDLNVVEHFKRNKFTLFLGFIAVTTPMATPLALSTMVAMSDQMKLMAVKDAAVEAQQNLYKRYPMTLARD